MVSKVNGAVYPGIWVEKRVAFIKATFTVTVQAIPASSLFLSGTATAVTGGAAVTADSSFAVVESAVVQALKLIGSRATVLGVSAIGGTGTTVDVMVGYAEGFFSDLNGIIQDSTMVNAISVPVLGAKAVITNAGTAGNTVVGQLVDVGASYATVGLKFAYLDGGMTVATAANKGVLAGPGATSGAFNSALVGSGIQGFYPTNANGLSHEG
jgi:hypothetical protein